MDAPGGQGGGSAEGGNPNFPRRQGQANGVHGAGLGNQIDQQTDQSDGAENQCALPRPTASKRIFY